jgi:hypothetical protein
MKQRIKQPGFTEPRGPGHLGIGLARIAGAPKPYGDTHPLIDVQHILSLQEIAKRSEAWAKAEERLMKKQKPVRTLQGHGGMCRSVAKIAGKRIHPWGECTTPRRGTYLPTLDTAIASARKFSEKIGKDIEAQRKQNPRESR